MKLLTGPLDESLGPLGESLSLWGPWVSLWGPWMSLWGPWVSLWGPCSSSLSSQTSWSPAVLSSAEPDSLDQNPPRSSLVLGPVPV